jgi:hypothetical protein
MVSRSALVPTFLTAVTAVGAGVAAILVSSLAPPSVHAQCEVASTLRSDFDGTPIPAGRNIWFNASVKATRPLDQLVTLSFSRSHIEFSAGGASYRLKVPESRITFDPAATAATMEFNEALDRFETTVPASYTGNVFLTGLPCPVAGDLPGGIHPVTWIGVFESDTPGTSLQWEWAAAVYEELGTSYEDLRIKPIDGSTLSPYANSDKAGTPERYDELPVVVGGARGAGASNYSGACSASRP